MSVSRVMCGVVLAGLMVGCSNRSAAPERVVVPNSVGAESVRESFQRLDPNVRTGVIIATRPESNLVSVGDVNVSEFKEGDILSFVDPATQRTLTSGRVVRIINDTVHARYDAALAGGRAPTNGDVAVRFGK